MPVRKLNEKPKNALLEAIQEIRATNTNLNVQKDQGIIDIITFCDNPRYLNLPANRFNLRPAQRIILKCFYMGTRGNENLKLSQEDWEWLYSHEKDEERDDYLYKKNICDVIKKMLKKEKEGFNFSELNLVLGRRGGKCRYENDRISTTEGSITFRELCDRINDKEKIGICTYDAKTFKRSVTYDIKAKDNGVVNCFEVITNRGLKETSSDNHPYLVWRNSDSSPSFVEMSQLKVGDRIATANCTELFGKGGSWC